MANCEVCGEPVPERASITCDYCGKPFCSRHRMADDHDCQVTDEEAVDAILSDTDQRKTSNSISLEDELRSPEVVGLAVVLFLAIVALQLPGTPFELLTYLGIIVGSLLIAVTIAAVAKLSYIGLQY